MKRKLCFWLGLLLTSAVLAAPPAQYIPRAIKELDDSRGVSLSLKFVPMWDGTKFTPRFVLQSDVTNLVTDLATKEAALGNPSVNGYVLSSTTGGVRSWIIPGSGAQGEQGPPGATGATGAAGSDAVANDTAYNATTWDGVTTIAPSKNAVRDKFESLTVYALDSAVVHNTGDETVAGTKTFSNSLNVGSGGTNHYSLFGAEQSSHGPLGSDLVYIGNSTTLTTQTVMAGLRNVMQFDGTSSSDARLVGAASVAATGSTASGAMTGASGNSPFGLAGSVNRTYHKGTGTVTRAFGAMGNVQSFSTGAITDSAALFAQTPSVFTATTWGSHAGLWVQGGAIDGTITTRYGVRVDTLSGGTTKWGLYVQTDPSFLGGSVTIGGGSPITSSGTGGALGTGAFADAPLIGKAIIPDATTDPIVGATYTGIISDVTRPHGDVLEYVVVFSSDQSDTNYVPVITLNGGSAIAGYTSPISNKSVSGFRVDVFDATDTPTSSPAMDIAILR